MKRAPRWWCVGLVGVTIVSGAVGAACQGDESGSVASAETSAASDRVFAASEVRRQFKRQGIPLREFVYDAPGPRVFSSVRAGPIFQVYVYDTVAAAASEEGLIFYLRPENYRVRGEVLSRRKANVVVHFEEGRTSVRRRLNAALESLD